MSLEGKRVLVADDEKHITRLVEINLERQGCEVSTEANGQEAVELLQEKSFDLAILDLLMPHMDGLEVLEWIRTNEATKDIYVIVLSTQTDVIHKESLPHQPNKWVRKPLMNFDWLDGD